MATAVAPAGTEPPARYAVGTLRYTRAGLLVVVAWLLWGCFCSTMLGKAWLIYPTYLLKVESVSNTVATVLTGTIPQAMVVLLCPAISFRSDRTRSRWGRRIPYMLFTLPFVLAFFVALGFSPRIATWLRISSLPEWLHLSPATLTLGILGVLVVGYYFFNLFVGSVFYYLYADVVPRAMLGRFLGLTRMVAILADFLFRRFLFPYSLDYMEWVFLTVGLLYFVGFGLMCLRVREGEYPPVEDVTSQTGILAQVRLYFAECFIHPIYVLLFLQSALRTIAATAGIGTIVFLMGLGVDLRFQGEVGAWIAVFVVLLPYPLGWLVDRYHPLGIYVLATVLELPLQVICYLAMQGPTSYVVLAAWAAIQLQLIGAASIPVLIALFPPDKYGQFCSANAMIRSFAAVLGGLAAGLFLDWVTRNGTVTDGYRFMYLWVAVFNAAALVCLLGVYRYWRRLGGSAYVAPGSAHKPAESAEVARAG